MRSGFDQTTWPPRQPRLVRGRCYLNNAAIAAESLREAGFGKVAVIDIDFHHGNGTQSLFYERGDVIYGSVHGDPQYHYPYHLGWPQDEASAKAKGRRSMCCFLLVLEEVSTAPVSPSS